MRIKPVTFQRSQANSFNLMLCFFSPAQVFNLSGSYAERGAVQGGAGGGLMGIRHEGKQASKPQQKPQT